MVEAFNRFLAQVVRVNYWIYVGAGFLFGVLFQLLDETVMGMSHMSFLINIGLPVYMFTLLQGIFCSIFYQEAYDNLPTLKRLDGSFKRGLGIPIPSIDFTFYSVMTKKNLNNVRKICGYIYAFSKLPVSINLGMVLASLVNVVIKTS